MKRWLFCLVALFINATATAAWDQDEFCRSCIEGNTANAQWGLELRAEMLKKCGNNPPENCKRKYEKQIDKRREQDKASVKEILSGVPGTKYQLKQSLVRVNEQAAAAFFALETGNPATSISADMYSYCKATPMPHLYPQSNARRPPPPPMPSLIGGANTQPGSAIAPISGGCTNYTVMGQNGQAAYCQKCCYGDGNCQVMCN